MNPLFALLNQQAAAGSTPPLEYDEEGNMTGMVLTGNTDKPSPTRTYDDYALNNTAAIMGRDQDIKETEEASQRRGMFGMKGTLRDVLGILGDAFLVQSGNAPMYAPTRRREKISDAWAGYSVDPIAAAERVAYYDPAMAQELLESEETRQLKLAQQQSLADARTSQIETRDYNRLRDARLLAQGILAQPGAYAPDGSLSPDAQGILTTVARQAGVTVQNLVGENLSPQALRLLGEAGMTVNQQRMLPIQQQRADASTSQAQSAAVRAARPPQGRAPRAESDREAAIRIGNKPEGERTSGEQAFYEKYTRPPSSGRSTRTLRSDPLGTAAPVRRFGPPRN